MLHGARGAMVPNKIERHRITCTNGIATPIYARGIQLNTFTPDRPRTKMTIET